MGYFATRFRVDEHRDALAKLWKENMSDSTIAQVIDERVRWLYAENPLGAAATWLVSDDASKDVVGCASLYPHDVCVKGRMMRAGIGIDFAIAKAHRVAGPAVILQRNIVKQFRDAGYAFTYTYPNKGSLAVIKRVGFHVVADASHWVKPVRSGYKLASLLPSKTAARLAAVFVDGALGLADRRHLVVNARRFSGALQDVADARFDELWERARGSYAIVGDKSAAYLNWRYARCKTARYTFFCLTDRKTKRLAGFVVFTVRDNKAFVADAFCQDLGNTLSHLLVRFAARARRARLDSIFLAYAGTDAFTRRLEGLDFIRREFSRSLVASVPSDMPEETKKLILDKESWFLFDGELDL